MLDDVQVLCHSSILIKKGKNIYIDPFKIDKNYKDADIIFITHSHYDHFSPEDIEKVKKDDTLIVATSDLENAIKEIGFKKENITLVKPNNRYNLLEIEIETVPAYNINKNYHPRSNEWVGYILKIDDFTCYIPGDTDITKENRNIKCDIAFVPIRWNVYNGL